LTPVQQEAQRDAAFVAIRRLYGEAVALWRFCRRGSCRRHKHCSGDVTACLVHGWGRMPPALQTLAYNQVMAGGPRRVAAATHTERQLRSFPPSNFVG